MGDELELDEGAARSSSAATAPSPAPSIAFARALTVAGWALAGHYLVAESAIGWHLGGPAAWLLSHLTTILVVALAAGGPGRVAQLGLRPARARFVIAGVLCGYTLNVALAWTDAPITAWFGPSQVKTIVRGDSLALALLGGALLGPLSEELLFRAVMTRAFATRWSWTRASVVSALAFALYHHNPHQLVPIFFFGLAAAYLTLKSGSIVPSLIMHAITNAAIALRNADTPAPLWRWIATNPEPWLGLAATLAFTGLFITARGAPGR